jgi:ABC-2 type transport system permease protein
MFLEFFFFEIKLRLKSVSTYCYFALWVIIAFFSVAAKDFGPVGAGKVLLNGPYATQILLFQLTFFGSIVMAAIFGTSILRDFQRDTYQIIFTKPIGKFAYLGGRWAGSLITTLFIFLGLPVGEILGSLAPWADHTRIAPISLLMLAYHYAVITAPQIFFLGTLFFVVAALTRRILVVYLQGAAVFVLYLIGVTAVDQAHSLKPFWPSVLDPGGLVLMDNVTKYWTVSDRNTLWMSLTGMFLWNRVIWLSVGVLALVALFTFFPMSAEALTAGRSKKQKKIAQESTAPPAARFSNFLPATSTQFSASVRIQQLISLTRIYARNIFREIPFWAVTLLMVALCLANGHYAGVYDDTNIWPVTYLMLRAVSGSSSLFLYIVATMYAGELVWRERDTHFEQIHDALPVPGWIDGLGKFFALSFAELFLLGIVLVCGVLSQAIDGYYNFEIPLYLKGLLLISFPSILIWMCLVFFLQTILNNKFIAHGIAIVTFFIPTILIRIGYPDRLYLYGIITDHPYSDMNGYGHFVQPLLWSTIYWLAWAALLGILAVLFTRRGAETSFRARLHVSWQSVPGYAAMLILVVVVILGSGSWFYYNTHILNRFETEEDGLKLQASYEKHYKQKYDRAPQPKITAVDTKVDIYPEQRSFHATGTYTAVNESDTPIQDIHISNQQRAQLSVHFDRPATLTINDPSHLFLSYHLAAPLAPHETIQIFFDCGYTNPGFRNNDEQAEFAYNGTFFDRGFFPWIGYRNGFEIDNPVRRREQGLGPYQEMPDRGDPYGSNTNLFINDSNFVTFHTVVSTIPSQIAISPGYLQREWQQDGRRYFEYSMGSTKILNFISYQSGDYAVKRDTWRNASQKVNLEIYYHPTHTYDLDKMIGASKAGLDYYTKNFGPYQFNQYRVIEFPRYRAFAQSFPNTIPFSEDIGFIGRLKRPEDIDFTWFVIAHELAHQWWAHQFIGGKEKGSNMMSESLAEYSALRVMEHRYGDDHMRLFLRHELDDYLRGRSGEVHNEEPLALVQNGQYIWYRKGSVVMYALSDAIGEDNMNAALKELLDKWKFNVPPYPDTRDLVAALRRHTPADLQYMITDMFETITLYDNKAVSAKVEPTADHKYKVTLIVDAKKLRANGDGAETEIPIHDYIEVGVFKGKKDKEVPLHTEKVWITKPRTTFTYLVNEKPTRAGIDPYSKLIDRNPEDNVADVE